jgi:hypothetical protein
MKVYAVVCEYGAASIRESIEIVCKTRKIAESYYLNEDFIGRPLRVDEMIVWDKKWEPTKSKKKKAKGRS